MRLRAVVTIPDFRANPSRVLITLVVTAFAWSPTQLAAQLANTDSVAIAAVLAPVVRARLHAQAISQDNPTLLRSGAPWNRLLEDALAAIDTSVITHSPSATTARFNVFTAVAAADSVVINVGITHCNGVHFDGAGEEYVVKRDADRWRIVSKRFSGSGMGRCGN